MGLEKLPGYGEARQLVDLYTSPRARHMLDLERYVDGTQYDGRPDWFSDEAPLWERAPCVVYPAVRSAIASNADLLFGGGRFPAVGLAGDNDEEAERALDEMLRRARFSRVCREVFAVAQGSGSAAAIVSIRGGHVAADTVRGRWCEPELEADGSVRRLVIQYPYVRTIRVADELRVQAMLFRREIDAQSDTTFLPAKCREDGTDPKWQRDPKRSFAHGLGVCPVLWYPHMQGCAIVDQVDGFALHEYLTDEIRALDFTLSQRHRAALYCGDPQWTEVGVEPGHNPTAKGRHAEVPASVHGRPGERPHASYVAGRGGRGQPRKKGPGIVWQYENPNVKVELHSLPGNALEALERHAADLRMKLCESLGVVFLDPGDLPASASLSGKALEALRARQLDRCDGYREDFGDRFMIPAAQMMLRIARDRGVQIEGLDEVEPDAEITLSWPSYFRADSAEQSQAVDRTLKAVDGGLLSRRRAVESVAQMFGVTDVDAELDAIELERAERQAKAMEIASARKPNGADDSDSDSDSDSEEDEDDDE